MRQDIDEWEAYWTDALIEAGAAGDQLAHTVTIIFASFVRITLNTRYDLSSPFPFILLAHVLAVCISIYTRWRTEQQQSLSRGGNGRPELSDDDWHFLQIGVTAAERLIYCLSMESRVNGNPFRREVNWSSKVTGPRPALKLDPVMVDIHRTALDPITCVVRISIVHSSGDSVLIFMITSRCIYSPLSLLRRCEVFSLGFLP